MLYKQEYHSPLGILTLLADECGLLGAWFAGQQYELRGFEEADCLDKPSPILLAAQTWLDAYFAGENPAPFPHLAPQGTAFQQQVWTYLQTIPSGQRTSYGEIARQIQCRSAQAVGGAVGKNPLSLFIPCHRVLGTDGSLTGYAGGLERKMWLLEHEK